jgi:hypothetical protein
MLWMKAWFETRRWLAVTAVFMLFVLALAQRAAWGAASSAAAILGFYICFWCILLAGAGIQPQPTFTLTLPVSRLRLLSVRAALGLMEIVGFIVLVCWAEWAFLPVVRGDSTSNDLLRMILECTAFGMALHCLSVFFATFFDWMWQMYASLFVLGLLWFLSARLHLPRSVDIFRLMTGDSALVTHTLYWGRIAVSSTLALILFLAAARIVQTREY